MRQSENNISIVGTVKSKNVRRGNVQGVPTISLDLVVQSKVADRVNVVRVSFFAKNTSKLYAGYETSANELKTIKDNGTGDRVRITGSLDMNEFMTKDGQFVSNNKVRGLFCNRLGAEDTTPDCCGVVIECVVLGTTDELKDGKMTGVKKVQAYSVGYNDSIIELKDLIVAPNLAGQFANIYQPNSTGKLFVNINNYAEVGTSATPQQQVQTAFGTQLNVMPDEVKNYVNNLEIVGGDMPTVIGKYTMEEIAQMRQLREQIQQKIMSTPAKPQTNTQPSGFGNGFGNEGFGADFAPIDDDSMPF